MYVLTVARRLLDKDIDLNYHSNKKSNIKNFLENYKGSFNNRNTFNDTRELRKY
jgi:hypothetical protein